jgi:hypothetical protein
MMKMNKYKEQIRNGSLVNGDSHRGIILVALLMVGILCAQGLRAQQTSPIQTGHYSPAFSNVRDMAKGAPGLAIVLYNQYMYSNKYADKDGNLYTDIPLDYFFEELPPVDLNVSLGSFATVPAFFYGVPKPVLGGAQWMIGVVPSYVWADASFITEQRGGVQDSVLNQSGAAKLSGFGDLYVAPLGLTWGWDHLDLTFYYGFTAPTGRYETGADDNMGLGFWTHQPQLFTYYYPNVDQSTALMLGLTYELNGKVKGEDFNPGNRFSLEWGISQYVSGRLELGVMGGHNWQVSDDKGDEVWWPTSVRDKKSTLAFTAGYWAWAERLQIVAKYGFDFGCVQRFKSNMLMLNVIFATNALTGSKSKE